MKIGILTQRLHTNYGGLLQNYALQQIFIRAGYEVETIDWEASRSIIRTALHKIKVGVLYALFPHMFRGIRSVSYTHLTLPTTPYV